MEFSMRDMDDTGYCSQEPVILLIGDKLCEATYESSRGWFYVYNNVNVPEHYIMEDDPEIKGWIPCNV